MEPILSFPAPTLTRNTYWVLRTAAALLVIAVWLALLLQMAVTIQAETRLGNILREANAFAELPNVRRDELLTFVTRRTERAGWRKATIQILPAAGGRSQVTSIEIPTDESARPFFQLWGHRRPTVTWSLFTPSMPSRG